MQRGRIFDLSPIASCPYCSTPVLISRTTEPKAAVAISDLSLTAGPVTSC
jgi:hypothetical protein